MLSAGKHTTGVNNGKAYKLSAKRGNSCNERRVQKASKNKDKLTCFPGILEKIGLLRFKVRTGRISIFYW